MPGNVLKFARVSIIGHNRSMARVYVGIGSNLGDRSAQMKRTCDRLAEVDQTELLRVSPVYETDPVGPVPQGPFLNGVAELETKLVPERLLGKLNEIEQESGRPEPVRRVKWGPRSLDLDIILFEDRVICNDRLVIPHPLMHERWFVLKPLCDLNPNVVHPLLEMTVGALLRYLEDTSDNDEES